ncbi:MAG TPA: preprotein translocase subunit SecE [Aggregatilineaceae bacterium]|nr:preprotein translocase subunit SecE [Aggregatilineaceae bacterium]
MARTRVQNPESDEMDNIIEEVDDEKEEVEESAEPISDRRRRRQHNMEGTTAAPAIRKDRPTPSSHEKQRRGVGSTGLINRIPVVRGLVSYFRGVSSEMRKVTWPSREDTYRLTAIVLAVTIAFAMALGALDAFFSWWFRQAFNTDTETTFLAVAFVLAVVLGGTYTLFRNRI